MITFGNRFKDTASPKLRIVVPTPLYGGSLPTALHAADAFADIGHECEVLPFDRQYEFFAQLGCDSSTEVGNSLKGRFADLLSDYAVERAIGGQADLVWYTAQSPVSVAALRRLRTAGIKTALWFVEDVRRFDYWRHIVSEFDVVFTIQVGIAAKAIESAGARRTLYLPCAANPKVHRPLMLSDEERTRYGARVSFVGAGYANRVKLFSMLSSPDLRLWGNDWPNDWVGRLEEQGRRVSTEESVKIFNASDVNLNIHSAVSGEVLEYGDFVNPRTFEIASCGAFQLVNDQQPLKSLFSPDELTTFTSIDALENYISAYAGDADGRRNIADAARERVLREHTYVHRMQSALRHIYEIPSSVPTAVTTIADLKTAAWGDDEFISFLSQFDDSESATLAKLMAKVSPDKHRLSRSEKIVMLMNEFRHWGIEKGVIQ